MLPKKKQKLKMVKTKRITIEIPSMAGYTVTIKNKGSKDVLVTK